MSAINFKSTKSTGKNTAIGIRVREKSKSDLQQIADEKGISLSELIERYIQIGKTIDRYWQEGSQLVIFDPDPEKWDRTSEIGIPFDEIVNR